jgi:nucleotide-binding universal stress UspA family protein
MELARILLPADFSERSIAAARHARVLAAHFHSELTLLHVLTPPHYEFGALEIGGTMLSELYTNRTAQVGSELDMFLADELKGLNVKRVVQEGDAAQQIVAYAHNQGVDLIVMPTHGYGPFRRFILGSITAKVLHDADCPVMTGVHMEQAHVAEDIRFHNIVCALDLGTQSARTLDWATRMQVESGARLTVIHVTPAPEYQPVDSFEEDNRAQMARAASEEIQKLKEAAKSAADISVAAGDPPKVVCSLADCLKADLMVIGRGSAGGVFGRLRTNAYAIIRESPCPVVSV